MSYRLAETTVYAELHPRQDGALRGPSYTDAFGFQLAASPRVAGARSTPALDTCSESQGPSFCDYSTNYCNIRNLYCNTAEGCKVVHHELTSKEEVDASCYHAPKCQGSLKGYETNKEMCKR